MSLKGVGTLRDNWTGNGVATHCTSMSGEAYNSTQMLYSKFPIRMNPAKCPTLAPTRLHTLKSTCYPVTSGYF